METTRLATLHLCLRQWGIPMEVTKLIWDKSKPTLSPRLQGFMRRWEARAGPKCART